MSETIIEIEGHIFKFLELNKKPILVLSDKDRGDALDYARAELICNHREEFNKLFEKFQAEIFTRKKILFGQLKKKYKG